ncbi:MAG: DEAD/DEAH box helicase, partial [Eubacteriales bacterium]
MSGYVKTVGVRILDIPYYLDIEYTYYVPDGFSPEISCGDFLLVPFGAGNKKMSAVAVSLSSTDEYSELKPVYAVSEDDIHLSDKMLRLADFLCGRTFCSFGDAVKRLIPSDLILRANEYYAIKEGADTSHLNKRAKELTDYLEKHGPTLREKLLSEISADSPEILFRLLKEGIIKRMTEGAISEGAEITLVYPREDADISVLEKPRTPASHTELFSVISECGVIEKRTLIEEGFKPSQIKALEKKGLIRLEKQEYLRNPYADVPYDEKEIILSEKQEEAKNAILALADGKPHAALLYGVTGSGKTSVILSVCESIVKSGKSAIVLVPEIALTWQSVSLFAGKFKDRLAVIHSSLSEGEKADTYKRIKGGNVDIVLGTRSALFAPLENLGLIVIDEEQEHTYKSDM